MIDNAQSNTRVRNFFILLGGGTAAGLVLLYLINPFSTASHDPRARVFGYTNYRVPSASMSPTLQPSDLILTKAAAYLSTEVQRGDILVFFPPDSQGVVYVSRAMGLPGDKIRVVDGIVHVNGVKLNEPYLSRPPERLWKVPEELFTIADDELFMLGDNRYNSRDSRFYGPAKRDAVVGKVTRIWFADDAERIGRLESPQYQNE